MDDIEKMMEKSEQILVRSKITHVWCLEYRTARGSVIWSMLFFDFEDAQRTAQLDVGPIEWGQNPVDEDAFVGQLSKSIDFCFHLVKMKIY